MIRNQLYLAVLLILVLFFPLEALDPGKKIFEYKVEHWNESGGATALLQSKEGYLWASSGRNLVRGDGITFETINLPGFSRSNDFIFLMFLDRDGHLWVETAQGFFRFQGNSFEYVPGNGPIRKALTGPLISVSMIPAGRRLFFPHSEHVFILPGMGLKKMEPPVCSCEAAGGGAWFFFESDGLIHRDDQGRLSRINIKDMIGSGVINCLFEEDEGRLWLGTKEGAYLLADPLGTTGGAIEKISDGAVTAIIRDRHGVIWAGTERGLTRILKKSDGNRRTENLLTDHYIQTIYEDREGNLWIGTRSSGLICLKDTAFTNYIDQSKGKLNPLLFVYEDRDRRVWAGSRSGILYRIDSHKNGFLTKVQSYTDYYPFSPVPAGNIDFLVNANLKVLKLDDLRFILNRKGVYRGELTSLLIDSQNRTWYAGLKEGLFYRDGDQTFTYLSKKDFPRTKMIFTLLEDRRGNIWVGFNRGLHFLPGGDITHPKRLLDNFPVSCLYIDSSDVVWAGSYQKGLAMLDLKREEVFIYDRSKGLTDNCIFKILEDDRDRLWMTGLKGVYLADKNKIKLLKEKKIPDLTSITLDTADGMGSPVCSSHILHSAVKTEDGRILISTKNGLAVARPDRFTPDLPIPGLFIDRISADGENIDFKPGSHQFTMNKVKNLSIYLKSVSFRGPGKIRYRYRLDGIDHYWQEIRGAHSRLDYTGLKSGVYLLKVRNSNSFGVWNKAEKIYRIRIRESPVFPLVSGLAALFLILTALVLFYRMKNSRSAKPKYAKTKLDEKSVEEYYGKIFNLLEWAKIYRDPDLSLKKLSHQLSIPAYLISQVVNVKTGKNFFELINGYRINEAKFLLTDSRTQNQKILKIAHDVGFNNLSAFNRVFKKFTRMTPTEYKNKKSFPTS